MSSASPLLDSLRTSLDGLSTRRFVVAYSGGLDSHVLLHVMAHYLTAPTDQIQAVHVDHRLHDDSGMWSAHCAAVARELGIALTGLSIEEEPPTGESIESWARQHRYRLLATVMHPGDVLLTAHHRNDLAETALLQLLRGAGPHGLASIPERQSFGGGLLARPLLNVARATILEYARTHALRWIDDPSNAAERHDRNYLRNTILPLVEARWPAATARIAHGVALQQQAANCLDAATDAILDPVLTADRTRLPLALFHGLNDETERWVLRRWIIRADFPIPDTVHLQEMQRLLKARPDAVPCVCWKHAELRRYRNTLYLGWRREAPDRDGDFPWNLQAPLRLPGGVLSAGRCTGEGLALAAAARGVVVRFRRGGERCHPSGRGHSQSLKRLFQEWGVPSWQRAGTPLVFIGDELAAVVDHCVCQPFAAGATEEGWKLSWHDDDGSAPAGE